MIKRVVKLKEDRFSGLEHKINDFIDITLGDNEYIVDIKIVKVGEYEGPPNLHRSINSREWTLVAYLFIGEKNVIENDRFNHLTDRQKSACYFIMSTLGVYLEDNETPEEF